MHSPLKLTYPQMRLAIRDSVPVVIPNKWTFELSRIKGPGTRRRREYKQRQEAMRLLRKLGAVSPEKAVTTSVREVIIDRAKIVSYLAHYFETALTQCPYGTKLVAFMGASDYREMVMDPSLLTMPMHFQMDMRYSQNGRKQIMGVELLILPWMTGVMVLTQEMLERVCPGYSPKQPEKTLQEREAEKRSEYIRQQSYRDARAADLYLGRSPL